MALGAPGARNSCQISWTRVGTSLMGRFFNSWTASQNLQNKGTFMFELRSSSGCEEQVARTTLNCSNKLSFELEIFLYLSVSSHIQIFRQYWCNTINPAFNILLNSLQFTVLWSIIRHYLLFCVSKKRWITKLGHVRFDLLKWQGQVEQNSNPNNNVNHKVWECLFIMYLRFSELNSDSRNLRNCSLPTGSFKTSSMPNAHLFTLCWPGSLLQDKSCALKAPCILTLKWP